MVLYQQKRVGLQEKVYFTIVFQNFFCFGPYQLQQTYQFQRNLKANIIKIYGHNEIRNKPHLIHCGNKISSNLNVFDVKNSVLSINCKLS